MNERQSTIDHVSKQAFCSICFIGFGGLKAYIQDMFEILHLLFCPLSFFRASHERMREDSLKMVRKHLN